MSTLVIVLRALSIVAFAAPMLLGARGHRAKLATRGSQSVSQRAPLLGNLAACSLFLASLVTSSGSSQSSIALPLALSGCLLALTGASLVVRSRVELGRAWSLLPEADQHTGLVTTGPYAIVRHPIYLGLALVAMGQALAFVNGLASLIVVFAIVPTFAWRARAEETLLNRTFGERYAAYRRRTKMVIPHLL